MTMNENPVEFKAGDRVRYVGVEGESRIGYKLGMISTIAMDENGVPWVIDMDGHNRVFFEDEWEHASYVPSQAPQAASPILPSTEALDRFEALLGRLEATVGAISKGEVK